MQCKPALDLLISGAQTAVVSFRRTWGRTSSAQPSLSSSGKEHKIRKQGEENIKRKKDGKGRVARERIKGERGGKEVEGDEDKRGEEKERKGRRGE
jgi:hypothetical protein